MAKQNDLGLRGWVWAGKYGLQRPAYTLQRLTGLGIIFYLVLHLFVTAQKVGGEASWNKVMDTVKPLHVGEYLLFLCILFHAVNGFRLFWAEMGLNLGKPYKNIYPYSTCLDRNRLLFWLCIGLIAVLAVIGTLDFFELFHYLH